ncbi:MAG: T9SS type A sorting domain-containing protein [Candidatus Kapabacteria bacterium]|nr:T9SS type A sorting domain-containing protein [Ignavibacteriota bacterium]MCW5884308.1 T9SS type A sorting domain-containing protein [Candidatus Kapabacteria bacterium]
MQRLIRLSILVVLFGMFTMAEGFAQPAVYVSGSIAPGKVRIFAKDSLYIVNKDYVVGGTLIIEPGTTVHFHPQGRIIDSTGGRIIADGFAKATYVQNPSGINPVTAYEPLGYASFDYFFLGAVNQYNDNSAAARTIRVETPKDPTVHPDKFNHIFHVLLDKSTRQVVDIVDPNSANFLKERNSATSGNPNHIVVSFEQALMFYNARLFRDPENFDPNLKTLPWKRVGGEGVNNVNIVPAPIKFVGQPVNNFSREWGHIIVLPGARAAFFRNVVFENIRKDTTVDRIPVYNVNGPNMGASWNAVNNKLKELTNGAGGAITTFSSRTWLIDVEFKGNMARLRGGALNILQAPTEYGFTKPANATVPNYSAGKNPNLTNKDGSVSSINSNTTIPRIDNIDESSQLAEPFGSNNATYRQALDDARIAVFLGRMRNMHFENNYVQIANVREENIGGVPRVYDIINQPAQFPYGTYANGAYGGAVYVGGDSRVKERNIEIGFGVNHSLLIGGQEVFFPTIDKFSAIRNQANNYQNSRDSKGSRGGAVYVGPYTSLIAAGQYSNNKTYAKYYDDADRFGETSAAYSIGGGIFIENSLGRLQVRGGPEREGINETYFTGNMAAAGGAIYVDGNTNPLESPVIGGSDTKIATRDYGFDIKFENNVALAFGGAILTKRNMSVNGSGGVEADAILGYDGKYPVRFWNNSAGFAGGAVDIRIPSSVPILLHKHRVINLIRAEFVNNVVGEGVEGENMKQIRGGGAVYSYNGDLSVIKATDFIGNTVYNGNGGAVSFVNLQDITTKRFWLSDLDMVDIGADYVPYKYTSVNDPFTGKDDKYPADLRMLTRFLDNQIILTDPEFTASQMGSGATQVGSFNRINLDSRLPENGIGLGGGLYILDSIAHTRVGRIDSITFNRVRFQNNSSYSGSAIYSDNYDLKLVLNRSLITGNEAYSEAGANQNVITGPYRRSNNFNPASSDLAGAILYGEVQGPLPSHQFSEAANSIYNNEARFLIRLPDAPDTKGILAGTTGIGYGGTDTLRGNYWGHTEANVDFYIPHIHDNPNISAFTTFFVDTDGENWLPFVYPELINPNAADPRTKGPFESQERGDITYKPVILANVAGDDTQPDPLSIPEHLVFSGHVYDLHDKGTDIKTADYSKRRMSPIEDFAVGIPPVIRRYSDLNQPSNGRYIKRWLRDPMAAELLDDNGNFVYPGINSVQGEFQPDDKGIYYHPIGYPLYLETRANYEGLTRISNHDPRLLNQSIFFVINLMTGDYVRANLNQVSEDAPYRETFRTVIELIPDSTNRRDPSWRRSAEGLANLGSGPDLLYKLYQNEYNEDAAALQGRRYTEDYRNFARVSNLFSNRPQMPASNQIGNNNWVTYFAGERYRSLPVRVGDSVLIVSRTVLWRDGVHAAATEGLAFRVTESTEPPVFTGDIVKLSTDTIRKNVPTEENPDVRTEVVITEFLNKVFVTEDRTYPAQFRTYSGLPIEANPENWEDESQKIYEGGRGRDSILNITAIDPNRFYDPRSYIEANNYARLDYNALIPSTSALSRWLVVRKRYAADPIKDGAQGYFELAGRPINPFIVPGGDSMTVFASNFPPHYRTLDSILQLNPTMSQDEIDLWIETYPAYLHAPQYDIDNARYLQQDTVNVASRYTNSYQFKIFVVNTPPVFFDETDAVIEVDKVDSPGELYVRYEPTRIPCGRDKVQRLIANVTDKLRFQMDINTTDELEDKSPAAAGWDFRYGRTAYGFFNTAIRNNPSDTTVIDSLDYDLDGKGLEGTMVIQSRPRWMSNDNLYRYDSDDQSDVFGADFTTHGQLNVRIDAGDALALLTPNPQYNNTIVDDTVFTVVVNDGHGGIASQDYRVFINVQPAILTETLPDAIEDRDYNPSLLDSSRMIRIFDPNFGQSHTYRLIYPSTTEDAIAIDPCFSEAGSIDLTNIKTTPEWLKINPNTGLLYGTPRVQDVPTSPLDEMITVVVTDENGLSVMKRISLRVFGVNHDPHISGIPAVECIDQASAWSTELTVRDTDLLRGNTEQLTLTMFDVNDQPLTGFTVNPNVINGNGSTDEYAITIAKGAGVPVQVDPDGKVTIKIRVQDRNGAEFTLIIRLNYSDQTDFLATINVANSRGANQDLVFGTSSLQDASTGDGNDGFYIGKLDEQLCEYELPPSPWDDVFDARWSINNRNGILRNIFPIARSGQERSYVYRAQFQAGDLRAGNQLYPVTIKWRPDEIPSRTDSRNPAGSTWLIKDRWSDGNLFIFNMNDPSIGYHSNAVQFDIVNGVATITVVDEAIQGFVIMHDWLSSVQTLGDNASATKISSVSPNPASSNATINFEVLNPSYVTLQVVDMIGNVVTTLVSDDYSSGVYSIDWNTGDTKGTKVASGQYMVRLSAGNVTSTYPIMIVR